MASDSGDRQTEIRSYVARPFGLLWELVQLQSGIWPDKAALICDTHRLIYRELISSTDRIATAFQKDGVGRGGTVAIAAAMSIDYVTVFLAILRTGAAVAPLSPSATSAQLATMLADAGASHLMLDRTGSAAFGSAPVGVRRIAIGDGVDGEPLAGWNAPEGSMPAVVEIEPEDPFNIIYSSGTTGMPKGIVQSHAMRWPQCYLVDPPGFGPDSVTLLSTPLYSNTTLVALLPALAGGGTVVLMPKFDAHGFLELSDRHHVTHAMLVPVQYRRILEDPEFDRFNLSSYVMKFATSAPFSAELKAEVLDRWPGGLTEYYGMTEGGGSCMLLAHLHRDKLHTVGQPIPGHEMLVIDDDGRVLPPGEAGEVVGRSRAMMNGYRNQPALTAEAEWYSPAGERYIRTGDVARMDADGFFTLVGRKKDMIISGGINIYPVDLEAVLVEHPSVREAAVVGAHSQRWGETPVGFVALHAGEHITAEALKDWANAKLGKMQRLADVQIVDELPRSAIGKVLKRELRERVAELAVS